MHKCIDNPYNMYKLWTSNRAATTPHSVQLIGKCIYTRNIVWDDFGSIKTIKQKIRENIKKGYKELASIIDVYTRYREKIIHVSSRYRIFDPGSHMIGQNTWKVV